MKMRPWVALVVTLIIGNFSPGDCIDCYNCSNIQNVSSCHSFAVCQADHVCSTVSNGIGDNMRYDLGCRHKDQCPNIDSTTSISPVSIVGRDVRSLSCDKCCAVDVCNKAICLKNQIQIDAPCADDPTFNCAQVSAVVNLCADKHHAKTVCRKYCGLCDLIDGAWSSWDAWSSCDVTCGDGTSKRLRMCDSPTPANDGLPCFGSNTDQRQCSLDTCPVHGGWSTWTDWGTCSVTCGVGLQRKERTCSNPYPSLFGNHCFGDNADHKTCFVQACADGSWSLWSTWTTCSKSCNGGLKSRDRSCDNPTPSPFGHSCIGNNLQKDACNSVPCAAQHVAFFVHTPNGTFGSGGSPIFTEIIINEGGGYDISTGIFTCPVAGLYMFSATIGAKTSSTHYNPYCYIMYNGSALGIIDTVAKPEGYDQSSLSLYLELHVGDTVALNCTNRQYVSLNMATTFTGALTFK